MNKEYANKIVDIGKKGFCTDQDLSYFSKNLPHIANIQNMLTERNFSQVLGVDINQKTSLFTYFIKGCHLIEMKAGGFGSPSATANIIDHLKDQEAKESLYNWIAINGGNYFIGKNISYKENQELKQKANKRRLDILLEDQRIHAEAVAAKKLEKDKHTKVFEEAKNLYKKFKKQLEKKGDKELMNSFNKDVGHSGLVAARAQFNAALLDEFKNRGFDFSAIGNKHSLSFAKKIKLVGKKIIIDSKF